MTDGRSAAAACAALIAGLLAGCATVAADDRAWTVAGGTLAPVAIACPPAAPLAGDAGAIRADRPLSLVSWNIHRNADEGWEADLERFAAGSDLVLLQEATLTQALRERLALARLEWLHADAWSFDGIVSGVLLASSQRPRSACVQRSPEPLVGPPKSSLVAWFRLEGRAATLAVATVHSVNFTLDTRDYRRQLDGVLSLLAAHDGPAILAGDFNTWSAARASVLAEAAGRAGLAEVEPRRGARATFLGKPADYLFVRGLLVDDAWIEPVGSSDHAPIRAVLRFAATSVATPGP